MDTMNGQKQSSFTLDYAVPDVDIGPYDDIVQDPKTVLLDPCGIAISMLIIPALLIAFDIHRFGHAIMNASANKNPPRP